MGMPTDIPKGGIVKSAVSKIQKSKPPPPPQSAKPKYQSKSEYERLISSPTVETNPAFASGQTDSVEYVTFESNPENIYDPGTRIIKYKKTLFTKRAQRISFFFVLRAERVIFQLVYGVL